MASELLFYRKNVEPNGDIVEMKIWKVPVSKSKPHGVKFSLVCIREGNRRIGYDNGEGKGYHKHYGHKEYPYYFKDVNTLIADFYRDVERLKRGEL
ncbi:MAG: DUF6516 family protein [Nitrospirae bacterium]|nr:DUF6516 family protein [Nitrospirota bacterium]